MSSVFKFSLAGVALATIAGCGGPGKEYVDRPAYLRDSSGAVVMAQGYQTCVRASDWTPARGIVACGDATAPAKVAAKPAPKAKPEAKPKAKPEAKPAAKPKKPVPLNITEKIELQNIPFDQAILTDDNKKELAQFLAALRKATKQRQPVQFGAVVVTGHTDRLGSIPYNMKLSERRAVVAKDHLVSAGNVDPKLIFWEGKGPKQPIPVTKFCDNKMNRKQLIECLGPNRRVTVEVVGTALPQPKPAPKPEAKPEAKPAAKPKP
ncbi:MAG: OmpA family protein [Betaproteobacteria bacterium]|nr:OmpA family protein [Betaproteobacteria bacterium]